MLATASNSCNGWRSETYDLATECWSKMVGLRVDSRRVNHNTSILKIICRKHRFFFTPNGGFHWTEGFPFSNAYDVSMPWSHRSRVLVAGTKQSTTHSWLLWMFILGIYADPSLDRSTLIATQPEMNFFIYIWSGRSQSFVANARANTWSYIICKNFWSTQSMLPVCLRIGRFNVCSPGILLVVEVYAVHKTRENQNLMRIAGMQILDIGEIMLLVTAYESHILIRLLTPAACK